MKIAIISHPRTGERMHPVMNLINVLSEFCTVFLVQVDAEDIIPQQNIVLYKISSPISRSNKLFIRLARFLVNTILMNMAVYRICRRNNVNMILTFGSKIYSVLGSLFATKLTNSRLIIRDSGTDISSDSRYQRIILDLLEKFLYYQSDGVITLSKRERKRLKKFLGSKIVASISQGIDLELFNPRATHPPKTLKKMIGDSKFVFIYVGRLEKWKGIYNLISAFEDLKEKRTMLLLVGDGPCQKNIERILLQRQLLNRVILTSTVPWKLMPEYYSLADALVLPSLHEGVPNVVLEALAMELPVVATDVGGISDFVINGKTGFLTRRGDVKDLQRQMQRVLGLSSQNRKRMGMRGREMIVERCSLKRVGMKLYEFLGQFIQT